MRTTLWRYSWAPAAGLVLCLLLALHTPGLNGPVYWQWPWRRLEAIPLFTAMFLAALPFGLAQRLGNSSRASHAAPLVLTMLSSLSMMLVALAHEGPGRLLVRLAGKVQSPTITSYFTDAQTVLTMGDWFQRFPELMPTFHLHALTKPPGPILYYTAWLHVVPDSPWRAAWLGGLGVGILGTLTIPATYYLIQVISSDAQAAFCGASFAALSPALILFFPEFDQVYPVLGASLVGTWVLSLRAAVRNGIAFGLVLAMVCFFSYSLLVLGVLLAAVAVTSVARAPRINTPRVFVAAAWGLSTLTGVYIVLWVATGFDPIATFQAALTNQAKLLTEIERPYPATILFDLTDFAMGTGWLGMLLAVAYVVQHAKRRHASFWWSIGVLGQLVVLAITGLLPGETARVWLFMVPLLAIPVGLYLRDCPCGVRMSIYGALWTITVSIAQNMWFLR